MGARLAMTLMVVMGMVIMAVMIVLMGMTAFWRGRATRPVSSVPCNACA